MNCYICYIKQHLQFFWPVKHAVSNVQQNYFFRKFYVKFYGNYDRNFVTVSSCKRSAYNAYPASGKGPDLFENLIMYGTFIIVMLLAVNIDTTSLKTFQLVEMLEFDIVEAVKEVKGGPARPRLQPRGQH